MAIAACYNEIYGNLAEKLASEISGSLLRAMQHAIAEPSPAYYPYALEITEGDDKAAFVGAWPDLLSEGTPP